MKLFGERKSPGLLSFPMAGATLALDLPNRGDATRKLLQAMTDVVIEAGGRVYPAKDAHHVGRGVPLRLSRMAAIGSACVTPRFMSDFWRRVAQ